MAAGYFPTPRRIVSLINRYLKQPYERFRVLDPCAGTGMALADIKRYHYYAETFAIELDAERAEAVSKYTNRCLTGDYAACRMPKKEPGISLLFLNPPYDHDDEAGRLELKFLRDTQSWLMPGGVLVYIIPHYRITRHVARRLSTNFHTVTAYKFPEPEYQAFRQVVIFGIKREEPVQDDETAARLLATRDGAIETLGDRTLEDRAKYHIPPKPEHSFYFTKAESDPEDVLTEVLQVGAWQSQEWKDLHVIRNAQAIQPLMPLRRGHIAMVLAAGLMDNLEVESDGQRVLVKGRLVKKLREVTTAQDRQKELHRTREEFSAQITVLDLDTGRLTTLAEQHALKDWLREWQGPLAQKIVETFNPLHDMTYEGLPDFDRITDSHSKHRKLAGRQRTGLFESQKQAVAALTRRYMQGETFANLQATMGTGKTTIAISMAAVLKHYLSPDRPFPIIVVCPPHLVRKWPREIAAVVPLARGVEVRRIADLDGYVREVMLTGQRSLVVAVVSSEMLKLGSGWTSSAVPRKHIVYERKTTYGPRERVEATLFHCPDCGQVIRSTQKDGTPGYPITDESYFKKRRKCQAAVKKWVGNEDGVKGYWKEVKCGVPLYQSWRGGFQKPERDGFGQLLAPKRARYPIAEYIRRRYPGFFELAIVDEVHEYKGQSTDRGNAYANVVRNAKRVLAMTGTLFGGFATSLFYLLHRTDPRIRRDFAWRDGQRFASLYGVLERVTKHRATEHTYGHYSGLRRRRDRVIGKPGISPALVTRLLDSTVFLTLEDLGFDLPSYEETPVILPMIRSNGDGPDQYEVYHKLAGDLLAAARENWSLMSEYLQTTLSWPNACWRDEETSLYTVPALDDNRLYPKEEWLRAQVWAQKRRGRRVLLYVRQTATRDIQPRLKGIIEVGGLKAVILRSSVGTRNREAWVGRRVQEGLDVMICNARLVQTGLDLVDFPTIIFYEAEYSIYLMMQASARSWRLGQTQPVEVFRPVYSGTMEHRAVAHVAAKKTAAQLLYGDDVTAVFNTGTGGSFLEDLAKDVIANAKIPDLSSVFIERARSAEAGWLSSRLVDITERAEEVAIATGAMRWAPDIATVNQMSLF